MSRSTALLRSLSVERQRWETGSNAFQTQMGTIVGDVLLSSAFLAYAGKKTWNSRISQAFFTSSQNILLELRDKPNECLSSCYWGKQYGKQVRLPKLVIFQNVFETTEDWSGTNEWLFLVRVLWSAASSESLHVLGCSFTTSKYSVQTWYCKSRGEVPHSYVLCL